jgi:ATP-dependent DNA helicase RecG
MTATPIPRTAAMTVYGDLDVSVLDELPPGRTPISTSWVHAPLEIESMWADVRSRLDAGEQAYVVCPLIEESEKLEVASAQLAYCMGACRLQIKKLS